MLTSESSIPVSAASAPASSQAPASLTPRCRRCTGPLIQRGLDRASAVWVCMTCHAAGRPEIDALVADGRVAADRASQRLLIDAASESK